MMTVRRLIWAVALLLLLAPRVACAKAVERRWTRERKQSSRVKRKFISTRQNIHAPLQKEDFVKDDGDTAPAATKKKDNKEAEASAKKKDKENDDDKKGGKEDFVKDDDNTAPAATKKKDDEEDEASAKKKDKEGDDDKEGGKVDDVPKENTMVVDAKCADATFRESALNVILEMVRTGRLEDGTVPNEESNGTNDKAIWNRPWHSQFAGIQRPRSIASSPQVHAWNWLRDDDPRMSVEGLCRDEMAVTQRFGLAVLYFSTGGGEDLWINNEQWLSGENECDWNRIVCKNESREIVELDLSRNGLIGTIPKELSLLSSLKTLALYRNSLSGTIPNDFVLPKLKTIDLEDNRLTGPVFFNMTGLPKLEEYRVSYNLLSISADPSSVVVLPTTLRQVWVSCNNLDGSLDGIIAVGLPSSMEELVLNHNALTGTFPTRLMNLDSLRVLKLQRNQLIGTIPSIGPGQWSMLEELRLERNQFRGGTTMPASICGLRRDADEDGGTDTTTATTSSWKSLQILSADCTTDGLICDCCTKCF